MKKIKWKRWLALLVGFLLLFLGFLCCFAARWYLYTYGRQSVNSILFTLLSGLGGLEKNIMRSFLQRAGIMTVLTTVLVTLFFTHGSRFRLVLTLKKSGRRIRLSPVRRKTFVWLSALIALVLIVDAAFAIGLPEWVVNLSKVSHILDEEYVDPHSVEITFPEKKRNLVYIFAESMETTFFSKEQGGSMEECIIPELYQLAQENTNFSETDRIGGWGNMVGGSWTAGGMVNQIGGLPLLLPFGGNNSEHMSRVLPGATLLWDLLHEQGYNQVFMMGSDKTFSGKDKLMTQHGIDTLYDYNSAVAEKFIPEDYFVWWGIEDAKLFNYAREKITALAEKDEPFNVTLLTVDTHMTDGYLCELCGDRYSEQYENVYACSSARIYEFVEWLKQQPCYEDTTIVICGDHLSMDGAYIRRKGLENAERKMFNCIINAPVQTEHSKNRGVTALDVYPTVVAALGCTIEGERLGLGTNLYSDVPTLSERMGLENLKQELNRSTIPYLLKFLVDD